MSDLRSTILSGPQVRRESVTLPINGTPVVVEVRGISAGARGRILNSAQTEDGTLNHEKYYALLVIETAHDPESGALLFGAADFEAINALPSPIVRLLAETADRISGLSTDAFAVLEKNSGATANVATDSASPSDSAAA